MFDAYDVQVEILEVFAAAQHMRRPSRNAGAVERFGFSRVKHAGSQYRCELCGAQGGESHRCSVASPTKAVFVCTYREPGPYARKAYYARKHATGGKVAT